MTSAVWHTISWVIFGVAYVVAVVFVSAVLSATAGSVILVLAAGSRLSAYVAGTVGEIGFLRGVWLDGSRRLAWLEDYTASLVRHADAPVPERLTQGIRFERVSFAHRFSTVRMADFIVVIDGSRVVESGTHEELMAKGGQYAELYGIQAAAYR